MKLSTGHTSHPTCEKLIFGTTFLRANKSLSLKMVNASRYLFCSLSFTWYIKWYFIRVSNLYDLEFSLNTKRNNFTISKINLYSLVNLTNWSFEPFSDVKPFTDVKEKFLKVPKVSGKFLKNKIRRIPLVCVSPETRKNALSRDKAAKSRIYDRSYKKKRCFVSIWPLKKKEEGSVVRENGW